MNQTYINTANSSPADVHRNRRQEVFGLEKARCLTTSEVDALEQKEYLSPEELRLLLYRVVDDEYRRP